jgi:hypothetical protein
MCQLQQAESIKLKIANLRERISPQTEVSRVETTQSTKGSTLRDTFNMER